MSENDYTIIRDLDGSLLQDLDRVVYQNYDVSYMPVYGNSYKLTNYNQTTIANTFIPYASSASLIDLQDYITFDANDILYITDRNGSRPTIQYYITTGITFGNGRFADIGYPFTTSEFPYGIAFDASGILYVTMNNSRDWNSVTRSWILKINISTLVGTEINVPGITFGHLYGCTFDNVGNFYVADNTNNVIIKINMVDYSTGTASIYANLYNGITRPTDICFDNLGNGYISNLGGNNVIKISTDNTSSIFGSGLVNPSTLVFNSFNNILYVANFGSNTTIGTLVKVINGTTTIVTNNQNRPYNPYSLAIDSTGKLYATSTSDNLTPSDRIDLTGVIYIDIITPDNIVSNYSTNILGNVKITSVIFDSSYTYLYASAYKTNEIWRFQNSGAHTGSVFYNGSSIGTGPTLTGPTALAFDNSGNLYVANTRSNQIIYINITTQVGQLVTITGYSLNTPSSIQFDGTGVVLYVANYNANTICTLTFSTTIDANSTLFNTTGIDLLTPTALSFNSTYTKLYVSCNTNNKILEVDMTSFIATQYNLSGLPLSAPTGIVYDSSSRILYISNQSTSEIYYITNYNYVAKFDIIETAPNVLSSALNITLDSSRNLYVANSGNASCPIALITQNNALINVYDYLTTISPVTTNSVPDREYKNLYFCTNNNIYRIDENNILYNINDVFIPSGVSGLSITLGEDLSGTKFLALVSTQLISSAYSIDITFIPYTTIPTGTFSPTSINITTALDVTCIVFADISDTRKSLFISTGSSSDSLSLPPSQFIRVDVNNVSASTTTFTSTLITIEGIPTESSFIVSYMAVYPVYQSGNNTEYLYIGARDDKIIYRVDITGNSNTYTANKYFDLGDQSFFAQGCKGISLDDSGYLYTIFGGQLSSLYRVIPNPPPPTPTSPSSSYIILYYDLERIITNTRALTYSIWDQSLITYSANSRQLFKYYIGFPFTGMNDVNTIGPYDDTGYIFDITAAANTYNFNFNIYTPYVVIDPSNIPINTPTEVSIHFVIPFNQPEPADSYLLLCNGNSISDVFCNNCTYNKSSFFAGTFPTGLVYSNFSQYLYVALDNDTISRIDTLGVVENDFIPASAGLNGPTSLVLDASFNMFILNARSSYISYLTLENNIISINNDFFTGINTPICLTYDNFSNDYLYLLSGIVPNMRLTKILASDSTQNEIIGLPFGTLYNSNGLTIDEFNPGFKFLYVSDTDQNGNNRIIQISLSDGLYTPTPLITGLIYKPFTMTNKNDGYLYIANKTSNSISKVSVQSVLIQPIQTIQPWVSNSISVPAGLAFDGSGNLYVANSGTSPRNSRISKIYIDYYFFTNVNISSLPCNAQIYDITTKSYVIVNYYSPPGDSTAFPIPIPYPINM